MNKNRGDGMKLNLTKEEVEEGLKISLTLNSNGAKKAQELYSDLLYLHTELEAWKHESELLARCLDWELNGYIDDKDKACAREILKAYVSKAEKEKNDK